MNTCQSGGNRKGWILVKILVTDAYYFSSITWYSYIIRNSVQCIAKWVMWVSNSRLREKIRFSLLLATGVFQVEMVEVHVSELRGFLSANFLRTLALLLWPRLYCNPPMETVIGSNPVMVEMWVSLTFTELSTQKTLLLAMCKYNALSGCFILYTNWSVQRINRYLP